MNKKTFYLFEETSGLFISLVEVFESPEVKGEFLSPKFSTDISPPEVESNEVVIFKEGEWKISPNNSGVWYDELNAEFFIADPLEEIPENWSRDITELPLSPKQIRDEALANITWTRPSDEVVVQIRHPKFAPDIQVMEGAISRLEDGESRSWIDVEDNPITMSKEEMMECVEHGYNEIDRIYTEEYIPTL
jgi:hypothetical protein